MTASIVAIAALDNLTISVDGTEGVRNVAVQEEVVLRVLQEDGSQVNATTAGMAEYLSITWTINNGTKQWTKTSESTVSYA